MLSKKEAEAVEILIVAAIEGYPGRNVNFTVNGNLSVRVLRDGNILLSKGLAEVIYQSIDDFRAVYFGDSNDGNLRRLQKSDKERDYG